MVKKFSPFYVIWNLIILSQEPTEYLYKINIIPALPSCLRLTLILSSFLCLGIENCLFPLIFSVQNSVRISLLPHACHKLCPSPASSCGHPNSIWWRIQFLQSPVTCVSPRPKFLLNCKWNGRNHSWPDHVLSHYFTSGTEENHENLEASALMVLWNVTLHRSEEDLIHFFTIGI